MGLGAVEQVGPTTQLFLKHRPECGLRTQNLETVDTGVDTTLSKRERGAGSVCGLESVDGEAGSVGRGVGSVDRGCGQCGALTC